MTDTEKLMTLEELAEYFRISVKSARRLQVPHAKVGRTRLYRWRDVQDYLEAKVA